MVDAFPDFEALEEQLRRDPNSKRLLEQFLSASLTPEVIADSRRIEHIVTYVRHYPRTYFARCPFVHVHPEDSADGFERVEREWLTHLASNPGDAELARGLALFVAESDPGRALEILHAVEPNNQDDPELYTDMGRIPQPATGRLAALRRARDLGATQPNLLTWIARAAMDASDLEQAEQVGRELLALAAEVRAIHGSRLDWLERGAELRAKADTLGAGHKGAHELVHAISDHANHKHWGHTVLGVVAARRGDIATAIEHLRESATIVGEPRLSSYGPSFRLACEMLTHDQWDAVTAYLEACRAFWHCEETDTWLADLRARKIPEFLDQ